VHSRTAGDGIRREKVSDHSVARHVAQPKAPEASWEGAGSHFVPFLSRLQNRRPEGHCLQTVGVLAALSIGG
jgi:hypothetical protein